MDLKILHAFAKLALSAISLHDFPAELAPVSDEIIFRDFALAYA
jgi:hypothetical protein